MSIGKPDISKYDITTQRITNQLPKTPEVRAFQYGFASGFQGSDFFSPSAMRILARSFAGNNLDVAALSEQITKEGNKPAKSMPPMRKVFQKMQKGKKIAQKKAGNKSNKRVSNTEAYQVSNALYDITFLEIAKRTLNDEIQKLPYSDVVKDKLLQLAVKISQEKTNGYLYLVADDNKEGLLPILIAPDVDKNEQTSDISEAEILHYFKVIFSNIAPNEYFEKYHSRNVSEAFFLTEEEQAQQENVQNRVSELREEYKKTVGAESTKEIAQNPNIPKIETIQTIVGDFFAHLRVFLEESESKLLRNFDIAEYGFRSLEIDNQNITLRFNAIPENTRQEIEEALNTGGLIDTVFSSYRRV